MNVKYNKDKVTKFLDLIINDIENIEYFNIEEEINKYRDIDEHDRAYLPHSIKEFGDTYGLFEPTLDTKGWFKLTQKGIELKEYGKGLIKFEKKLKRKLSPFEKASVLFFAVTFLFAVLQFATNKSLENRVSYLESHTKLDSLVIDSLKTDIEVTKSALHEIANMEKFED